MAEESTFDCQQGIIFWYLSAASTMICSSDEDDKQKGYRQSFVRPDYELSFWATMLLDVSLNDESSLASTRFRRRFGVSYIIFNILVAKATFWFPRKGVDRAGRKAIPMALKVLASLRILAKGWHFDGIAELSLMHESTMQA